MFLAGVSKGVTGLGVPLVATPVLALLYGDLQLAIATGIIPTLLSDIPFVLRGRGLRRQLKPFLPFAASAAAGMAAGTAVLVRADQNLLKFMLGLVTLGFVAARWRSRPLAASQKGPHLAVSVLVGFAAGLLQGMAGTSGPVVTMFLFGAGLPRESFLFVLNTIFLVVDASQLLSLAGAGVYGRVPFVLGIVWTVPVAAGMALGFRLAGRVSAVGFRRAVLLLLALTGLSLALGSGVTLLESR
jgi:uncharacterized membrane protein YfcA